MQVLNSGYRVSGKPAGQNFIISDSFKKELKRCIKFELEKKFNNGLNLKKVFLKFIPPNDDYSRCNSKNDLFLIAKTNTLKESRVEKFLVGYNNAYVHTPKLIIENLLGDWPIVDPTAEVEPNSLKMRLEFSDNDFRNLKEFADREQKIKNGTKLDDYSFEAWAKDLHVDSIFNVFFKDDSYDINNFLKVFGEIINEYNTHSENQTHTQILVEPDLSKYEKKVFDPEQNTLAWKSTFRYDEITDEAKKKEIEEFIKNTNESQIKAVEEFNKSLEEPPKPYFVSPSGLIHSFDLKKNDKKNNILSIKVDLGSSSHGFEYILKGVDNAGFEISKIEVKGV
jgi:hypothetical protein